MTAGEVRHNRSFQVSPVDRFGREISPLVVDAAQQIGRRAIHHAEKLHLDPAIAANLLEEAAAAVSRALDRKRNRPQDPIRDLRGYLFRAFIRRVNKKLRRQLQVENAVRILLVTSQNSSDPLVELERKILIDELLTSGDDVTRDVFYRRVEGLSWDEIGDSYGRSSHAAESRFSEGIRRLAKRLSFKTEFQD